MDNRADIKIEFTIYGKTYKTDMSINYHPDYDTVPNWFEECYRDARTHWEAELYEANREQREREKEKAERADLERLALKYGGPLAPGETRRWSP